MSWMAVAGGMLIGLAAAIMLLFNGRIAGVSGISKGLLAPRPGDWAWRLAFVGGLAVGGALMQWLVPGSLDSSLQRPVWAVVLAGLMVGIGSVMANGCTSGHGVCGVSRLSPRSMVATATFMLTGFVTVYAWQRLAA